MALSLSDWRDLAAVSGVIVALGTLIKGLVEYSHQGAQKRAEQFSAMRIRFKDDEQFKEICVLLEADDPALTEVPFKDKRDFLGFFEEVALMLNSGLIRPAVAHYMFGYYALRCAESENFWHDVNRESPYWALFNDFVREMRVVEDQFKIDKASLRF